jgi:hypothetical protein
MNIEQVIQANTAALVALTEAINASATVTTAAPEPEAKAPAKKSTLAKKAAATKKKLEAEEKVEAPAPEPEVEAPTPEPEVEAPTPEPEVEAPKEEAAISHSDLRNLAKELFTTGELEDRKSCKATVRDFLAANDAKVIPDLDAAATAELFNTLKSL